MAGALVRWDGLAVQGQAPGWFLLFNRTLSPFRNGTGGGAGLGLVLSTVKQPPCLRAAFFLSVHSKEGWYIKFSTTLRFPSAAWEGSCGSWKHYFIFLLVLRLFFLIAIENFLHCIPELCKPLQPGQLDRWLWMRVVWQRCWMSLSWVSAAEVFSSLLHQLWAVRGAEHAAELFRISPWMNPISTISRRPCFHPCLSGGAATLSPSEILYN